MGRTAQSNSEDLTTPVPALLPLLSTAVALNIGPGEGYPLAALTRWRLVQLFEADNRDLARWLGHDIEMLNRTQDTGGGDAP